VCAYVQADPDGEAKGSASRSSTTSWDGNSSKPNKENSPASSVVDGVDAARKTSL